MSDFRAFGSVEGSRRSVLKWSVLGMAGLGAPSLLASCASGSTPTEGGNATTSGDYAKVEVPDKVADVLRIGGVYAATVNPMERIGGSTNHAFGDPLVYMSPGADPKPNLAESWEEEGNDSIILKIREGVPFHNGDELTAEDVKFTIETILKAGTGPAGNLSVIDKVEVLDGNRVRIKAKGPDPILLNRMYMVFPVPRKAYDKDAFARTPIGVGPWVIKENDTAAQLIRAERNEEWWRGKVATPTAEFYGFQDQTAAQSALEAGQLDVTPLHASANNTLGGRAGFRLASPPMGSAGMFTFNTTVKPFDDVRVRRAVNFAIDRPALIKNVLFGAGFEMKGQLAGEDAFGRIEDWEDPFPYDPAKAKELLAEAGYKDGFDTEVEVFLDVPMAEAVTGFLREVGINAKVKTLEQGQWLNGFVRGSEAPLFHKGVNYTGIYDVDVVNNYMTFPPPGAVEGGFQAWASPEWDKLKAASRELRGEERLAKLEEMAHLLVEEAPIVFLYHQAYTYGWVDAVQNFDPSTGFFVEYHDVFKPA